MDFIERLFHSSPDGGDGTLEAGLFAAGLAITAVVILRHQIVDGLKSRFASSRTAPAGIASPRAEPPSAGPGS